MIMDITIIDELGIQVISFSRVLGDIGIKGLGVAGGVSACRQLLVKVA